MLALKMWLEAYFHDVGLINAYLEENKQADILYNLSISFISNIYKCHLGALICREI